MQRYRVVIMLVLFGVLPVVVAFFVALSFLEEQEIESPPIAEAPSAEEEPPPPPPPETREVFAAARALPLGTLLGKDDLDKIELELTVFDKDEHFPVRAKENDGGTEGITVKDPRGYAVREAIAEGGPLTSASVVGPRQKGFLATVLRPGARAVTIRVGAATSHAGLIDPGDLVDVILSAELGIHGGERVVFSRTIAEDVRVVAIDRSVDRGDDDVVRASMTTATLEASPAQADRLVLGEHEGRLSLAVRSLAEPTVAENATQSNAVELREMLLSSPDLTASKARLRRVEELSELSMQQQLIDSRMQLRTAMEADARKEDQIRVFRGTAPAEVVVFERR